MWKHPIRIRTLAPSLTATFLLASAGSLAAQHPKSPLGLRHVQTVEPLSGPVGTVVRLNTQDLPIQAKIYVGVGATHEGWEELAEVPQSELGEVSATVAIPEFASWDQPLVFIVFNGIFSPIAISDPFHVTDEEGRIMRRGTITDEGTGCTMLRDRDDYQYALTGDVSSLRPGDSVVVEGVYLTDGPCASNNAIQVTRIDEVG